MATAVAIGISPPSAASTITKARGISPGLLDDALNAFARHRAVIQHRDYIGIADFSLPSWKPRFHIVNVEDGQSRSFLVAHGRGSDPAHQGWLQRFSNRSEEHTSELQSLMRISYAVFCLNKKKTKHDHRVNHNIESK